MTDQQNQQVATFSPPRLPWHPKIEERFGVTQSEWRVLTDAIFPAAKSAESIILAITYCKSRGLDIMKRPVHVVPVWSSERGAMVETIWPGISELRTTAFRTKSYAGLTAVEWGPLVTRTFNDRVREKDRATGKTAWVDQSVEVTFHEWGSVGVYRMLNGEKMLFPGPRVYWTESYARQGNSTIPNAIWQKRPIGQHEKVIEASALRRAFPEELGNEYSAEEMEGQEWQGAGPVITQQGQQVYNAPPAPPVRQEPPPVPKAVGHQPAAPSQPAPAAASAKATVEVRGDLIDGETGEVIAEAAKAGGTEEYVAFLYVEMDKMPDQESLVELWQSEQGRVVQLPAQTRKELHAEYERLLNTRFTVLED